MSHSRVQFRPKTARPEPVIEAGTIDAGQAAQIDSALMSRDIGYTLPILMELAGLSVAHCIYDYTSTAANYKQSRICVVCGPGNNGGDGLVAARHLVHFGYTNVTVVYPKNTDKFPHLVQLLDVHKVQVVGDVPENGVDLWVDCVFGFSFNPNRGGIRHPYDAVIQGMNKDKDIPIVSVDIPSGWDVNKGNVVEGALRCPDVLVSLTAPKLFAASFEHEYKLSGSDGEPVHYLGGRFVPHCVCKSFDLEIPEYPEDSPFVRLS